jgi:MFS family permease
MNNPSARIKSLTQRQFLSVMIVVVNTFSWYFPLYIFFENVLDGFGLSYDILAVIFGVHLIATVGSAIVGTILLKLINRNSLLTIWITLGIVSTLLLVTLEMSNTSYLMLISFVLGASLGIGFPSSLAYFGDNTTVENRGWLGGFTFFASGVSILTVGLLLNFTASFFDGVLILAAWRGLGLILFLLVKPKQEQQREAQTDISYKTVLQDRSFMLYILPWIMFCLVNFLEAPLVSSLFGKEIATLMPITEYGIGGVVALVGGWLADSVGRKKIVIVGFITLGIGFAVLGLFQNIEAFWYLYILIDGIAWGIFSLMFYLVIWSDLAGNRIKEKYYLLGVLPFLIASYIQILFTPFANSIAPSAAFSLASFFLFLAVLPLLYAPETLPEKKMELMRLRKFAEDAKKAKEKYERKVD